MTLKASLVVNWERLEKNYDMLLHVCLKHSENKSSRQFPEVYLGINMCAYLYTLCIFAFMCIRLRLSKGLGAV